QAVGPFLGAILDFDTPPRPGWTVYVLADPHQVDPLLASFLASSAGFGVSARKLSGVAVPGQPLAVYWDKDAARRLDAACRQTVVDFLSRTDGLSLKHVWAWEGLGLLLTHELIGTRLTLYAQADTTAK